MEDQSQMRVLVTGSEGFIGRHVVDVLRESHIKVVRYDLKLGLDIFNEFQLYFHMRECQLVIHLAGNTVVPLSNEIPYSYYSINVEGTARVFRAASDLGVKVIHASTGEVYSGNSHYAASKIGAEAAAKAEIISKNADIVILRFLNPYGPYQPTKYIIPIYILRAISGKPLQIHGKGEQRKDYIYVTDLARAIWESRKLTSGSICDVGTGINTSVKEIALIVQDIFKPKEIPIEYIEVKDRIGESKEIKGNFEQLLNINWRPAILIKDGIQKVKDFIERTYYD